MHSLTNCCAHEGAEQGSTPYQRLPRCPSSSLSGPNIANENSHSSHTSRRFDLARLDRRLKCQSTSPNGSFSTSSASFNADSNNCLPDRASHKHANTAAMSPDAGSNSCATRSQVEISCHIDNACNSIRTSDISQVQKTAINCIDQDTKDINTVLVKVCIIGDSGTGKTSFMAKYGGLNLIDNGKDAMLLRKICKLQDANIALHVWDFGGQSEHIDKVPSVCKDAAAIFIMFDLTRRSTLQRQWRIHQKWKLHYFSQVCCTT
ncbi:hypothetical protein KP509_21G036400 [Ceratopteris richardii]|uniref:Uncharacterized protein n=1 Tax=Ceratopteris richardii TaxID=49495 RepID=A0A8T2S915_CERRI|nr:hypothetical protein KP509_21G036400 [Ceratopteris richardii]